MLMTVMTVAALVTAGADGGLLSRFFSQGGVASYVVSAVIALGILIFIHELGHFLVAKAVGVGVERFSLGFGPRLWSIRRGETEYCLSAVPLGGYVKMMGEEAHGEELVHPPVEAADALRADRSRWFSLKPLWARTLIVFAGPGMNFFLAAAIFALIFMSVGRPVLPPTVGRVLPDSPAAQAGLQTGDRVLRADGQPITAWDELQARVQRSKGQTLILTVTRDGEARELTVTPRLTEGRTVFGERTEVWDLGITPYLPPRIGDVLPGSPAAGAGLRSGDRVVALDGRPIKTWDELAEAIHQLPGREVRLTLERDGSRFEVAVTPELVRDRTPLGQELEQGRIGIAPAPNVIYRRVNPVLAVGQGALQTWEVTARTLEALWKLVTGVIPASNLGGPLQIGVVAGQQAQQGLINYAFFVALISVNLAILNLLPVPMLDGGHLLFFAIEAVMGRPLSLRKRELAHQVGLALLILLMGFAFWNDLVRFFEQ